MRRHSDATGRAPGTGAHPDRTVQRGGAKQQRSEGDDHSQARPDRGVGAAGLSRMQLSRIQLSRIQLSRMQPSQTQLDVRDAVGGSLINPLSREDGMP